MSSIVPNIYTSKGETDSDEPHFLTSIVVSIDDDIDYVESSRVNWRYFIHSVALKWRVLRPDGTFLQSPFIDDNTPDGKKLSIDAPKDEAHKLSEIDRLLIFIFQFALDNLDNLPGVGAFENFDIGAMTSFMHSASYVTHSTFEFGYDNENYWFMKWTEGYINHIYTIWFDPDSGPEPQHELNKVNMFINWQPLLAMNFGDYQIQFYWEVEVKKLYDYYFPGTIFVPGGHDYTLRDGFLLEGSSYLNFQYSENVIPE